MGIHMFSERTPQAPPVSQAPPPPPPASISPTSDSGKQASRRSRKSERPLPTKALPTLPVTEGSLATSVAKKDSDNATPADKVVDPKSKGEKLQVPGMHPEILHSTATIVSKNNIESVPKSAVASSELPASPDKKERNTALSGSMVGCGTTPHVPSSGATSVTPAQETGTSLSGFLPGTKVGTLS